MLNESGLLDIGVNTANLTGPESIFYKNQSGNRKFCVSAEIDEEYEEVCQAEIGKHLAAEKDEHMNKTFSNPIEFTEEFCTTSTPDRSDQIRNVKQTKMTCYFLDHRSGTQGT